MRLGPQDAFLLTRPRGFGPFPFPLKGWAAPALLSLLLSGALRMLVIAIGVVMAAVQAGASRELFSG
mgnify:CR=1 FL=1